jgi:type IV fimbrial biogenesis protein FimT
MLPKARSFIIQNKGFTLIELMVTIAIVAILAMLAAPSLRDLMVKNEFASVGNEFNGSIMRARNEAVSRNSCVTMCMSSNVQDANPQCSTADNNWQAGWVVYLNPSCSATNPDTTKPEETILARKPAGSDYLLQSQANEHAFTFTPQGRPTALGLRQFNLAFKSADDPMTTKYGSNICMDGLGKTWSVKAGNNC